MGVANSLRGNASPIAPPATLRKALPAKPLKNLPTSNVSIFLETAQGISQIRKNVSDHRNMDLRP